MSKRRILDGIKAYAEAYQGFQKLQEEYSHFLAVGDQKTGVIGEFFAMLYAQSLYDPPRVVKYARNPVQTGWDIEVSGDKSDSDLKIQVKTVSTFSTTRSTTPLSRVWDLLYLIFLGEDFMPRGFWIVEGSNNVFRDRNIVKRLTMRNPDNIRSGSTIPWGENRVVDLLAAIREHA